MRAADQFIVKRGEVKTVIAGYHWFCDWGRDTMIALPGLTLVDGPLRGRAEILLAFAEAMDHGMLPNRFPDAGETPEYNTVDATLWFFEAVRAYLEYTGDYDIYSRQTLRATEGHHRLARARHALRNPGGCRRPAALRRTRRPTHLDGLPRSATGWSRRDTASRWRSRRSGTTRCAFMEDLASLAADTAREHSSRDLPPAFTRASIVSFGTKRRLPL